MLSGAEMTSSSNQNFPPPLTIDRWLMQQMVRAPIRDIDRYLVGVRWAGILLLTAPALLFGAQSPFHLPSQLVLAAIFGYNLLISLYAWRQSPLVRGRAMPLLLADIFQFALLTFTVRGRHSFYFIFILLAVLELALGYRWKVATLGVVALAGLQLGLEMFLSRGELDAFNAYLMVMKFILILLVGAFAISFSELVRREERLRREMSRAAARVAELNALLMKLGESALDSRRVLQAILESVHTVPGIRYSMVLSWLPDEGCWRVAASTHPHFDADACLAEFPVTSEDGVYFAAGRGASPHTPLPEFVRDPAIQRVSGVYLRSPEGELLGALVLGREQSEPLPPEDMAFLQSLALEAGLALRNARLYAQEQAHVARLERFQAVQRTYFSAISHELKTPLAVLKMLIPSLEHWEAMSPATRLEVQETMASNLQRLETMIRDSLESDRLEAGGVVLNPRSVSVRQAIDMAHEHLKPLLARKLLVWQEETPENISNVRADPARLDRILENLLSNAAKFSPEGGVIHVSAVQDAGFIRLCVEDEGPGVPEAERPHIFDRFYTTTSQDEALKGVGLGLFIARRLVELHGGRIWVEDAPGGGGRFCFTLPIDTHSPEEADADRVETYFDHR